MPAPRKYPLELMERGARMVLEARGETGESRGAVARVVKQLGVHPEALRHYVRQAEIDGGQRPGTTSSDAARIAELERENRELRRANAILRSAAIAPSTYYAAKTRPPSARSLRDEWLKTEITRVFDVNYRFMARTRSGRSCTERTSGWPGAPSSS